MSTIGSAALNTSISSGSADSGFAAGSRGIRGSTPFLVSTKIRSSSPGGRVNSNDVSPSASAAGSSAGSSGASGESSSFQSRICKRAISVPEGAESSGLGCARREEDGAGDCNMLSARVSNSNELSPVVNALASSARCAKALKISPHFPQRTLPPAARNTSADNLKTVSHLEHCVNTLGYSPRVDAAPFIALYDLHHIKTGRASPLHCTALLLH